MRITALVRSLAALAMGLIVAACAPTTSPAVPTATPSGSALASAAPISTSWVSLRVEQPASIEAVPTDAPVFCSPCHPVVGTYIDSLVALGGRFLAFGHDQPPSHAAEWTSAEGTTWQRAASFPAPEGSIVSAAVVAGGTVLAVGASGGVAAVWRSSDGIAWTLTPLAAPPPGDTEWLTSVAATSSGYVAAGYAESAVAQKSASFWRSSDGRTWVRASAPASEKAGYVTGLAAGPPGAGPQGSGSTGLVAVGVAGDDRRGTSAVWRSTDGGITWQSVASPSFASGRMLAVIAAGSGDVAVGERTDQTGAAAWYSPDGSSWVAATGPGLDNSGLQMVMNGVAAYGSSFVAAGWRTDAGNGSAVVWMSADGRSWVHLAQEATFSGAGLSCVLGSPRLLVGGTMGWPDTHAAEVWAAPPELASPR